MNEHERLSTGVRGLDALLGGGLLPGTLTVIAGATGSGKTQLGLQFAQSGLKQEGRRGVVFDMTCRGDSQSHAHYARRMFDWRLAPVDPNAADAGPSPERLARFFEAAAAPGDYLRVFDYQGRRVTRRDLETEAWRQWQGELVRKLDVSIAFLYGNFVHGVRRAVVDGIEPADRPAESIQLEMFEYVYHQILRKDPEWVARDLFRQDYRRHAESIARHAYDQAAIACLLLYTTHETMLEPLIERRLDEGDVLANANTIIYLGKVREGSRLVRGLHIPKHRGSACSDEIVHYTIGNDGLSIGA
jgi:KaiC/GvpD/RAD55 family RecA-like ATPase